MPRSLRRLGLPLVAGALLAAACDAPGPTPLPTPERTPAACADGFEITAGPVDSAAGLRAMGLTLRNCGNLPYPLDGFPVVRVLDDARTPLAVTVGNGSAPVSAPDAWDAAAPGLTVPPGGTARARVLWRTTVTDGDPVAATHLAVRPAAGAPEQVVTPDGGIDLGTTGRIALNAWRDPG
ncbi:DUF4232 domain-containing protein [Asanoa iriomotensis]|uniref:DUF4232 domain-containing protein n=1 Tax=Asanoa iriomotensis TaxID=234613 RepID=A0ABQ4BTZ1_9ACTN|nr:DUF4232 domain-containing protein [Asanoa iriomotensis]GIF53994.1 hypothetical protein Air01nite_00890 [Asanoa iriomotensis]